MTTINLAHARLPAAAYELALRLGARPDSEPAGVRLTQSGRMKTRLDGKAWMAFTATQTLSTRACAFDWRARAGPLGLVTARDALSEGVGRLDNTALGVIALARAPHTQALLRGELMRYLAELAWAPDAILHNSQLHWRSEGPDRLSVRAGAGDAESEVILSLDTEGRISGAFAADRPRSASPPCLPTPWQGRFSDYRFHQGRWLPFAGEVAWIIDGQEVSYWQARLNQWSMARLP